MAGSSSLGALTRAKARLVLVALIALACAGAFASGRFQPQPRGGDDDMTMYGAVVARVRAGASYWDAAEVELERGGYPLRPMFNWRPPLYAWVFGALPSDRAGQVLLIALALVAIFLGYQVMRPEGLLPAALLAILEAGVFGSAGSIYFSTELWAGVLIALSAAAYAGGRVRVGFVAALVALFFRELALPYCVVCVVCAERRERRAWLVGLGAFAIYFALHASRVAAHLAHAGAAGAPRSWLALGGLGFVVSTLRGNGILFAAPAALLAIVLSVSLLGLGTLPTSLRRAGLAALAYVILFFFVGLPFDFYWGLLYLPLLHFGTARAPSALRALTGAALSPARICGGSPV